MTARTRIIALVIACATIASIGVGTAVAAWVASASGTGTASADTVPQGTQAVAAGTGTPITSASVSWNPRAMSDGTRIEDYRVTRYVSGGGWFATADAVCATGDPCSSTMLVGEGRWRFAVTPRKATWTGPEGSLSGELHVPTRAPSNLAITNTNGSVSLTWTDLSEIETGYRVERSTNGGTSWTTVGVDPRPVGTTAVSDVVACGATALYRVTALNAANGDASAEGEAPTWPCSAPTAPTNLRVTSVGVSTIALAWNDNSTDESGFEIQRSLDGSTNWTTIATTAIDSGGHTDTGLTCGQTRWYRVRATSVVASPSDWAGPVQGVTVACQATKMRLQMAGTAFWQNANFWRTTVTFTVIDDLGIPVVGASVSSSIGTCVTLATGSCSVTSGNLSKELTNTTVDVGHVSKSGLILDADNSTVSIVVSRP